jgi:hypothetical protein
LYTTSKSNAPLLISVEVSILSFWLDQNLSSKHTPLSPLVSGEAEGFLTSRKIILEQLFKPKSTMRGML